MPGSASDILTVIQNGVTAFNNFGKQINGSLTSIQTQLAGGTTPQTTTTISVTGTNIVLSQAQYGSQNITFKSTLTASITVTFPTSFTRGYTVRNLCTGTSAFTITLQTTASGGQVIGCRPGNPFEGWNDGTNLYFVNLGTEVGGYWDYAGSSVPNWVSACTVAPYLNCNGATFASSIYPSLAVILGSTTLPDAKGRVRMALDQSAGRVSSAVAGFSPNTVGAGGGDQNVQAHTHANTLNDLGHTHLQTVSGVGGGSPFQVGSGLSNGTQATGSNNQAPMSITNASFGTGAGGNVQPTYVGGLTFIRAA